MFRPKVSIVIPVYNGANYVAQAIDSALAQTYDNIEVLVVNDGSKDDGATRKIAESYGARIRYLEKPNGGVATALNLGIESMEGDYFSWLSHDDLYYPEKVATQVQYLESLDLRDAVLYSDYRLIDERSRVITTVRLDHEMLSQKPLYSVLRGSVHGCSTLVPREAFARFGVFDTSLATTQDYDLWFKMARHIPFLHLPLPLIGSRWHPAQGSKTHPAVMAEANALWTGFATALTTEEKLRCEPTVYAFYEALARFLAETPYEEARQTIGALAEAEARRALACLDTLKVSVIVPVKNRIPLALEAVRSALQQSHQNLEVLAVDNASTEDIGLLGALAREDSRLRILECPNGGASSARNLGIESAQGDFLAFLDADDLWRSDKLSLQLREMVLSGKPVSYTDYLTLTESGHTAPMDCSSKPLTYQSLLRDCRIATPTVMVRADLLKTHPEWRFPEDMAVCEDIWLWLKLARHVCLLHLAEPLTTVRVHSDSSAKDSKKQVLGLVGLVWRLSKEESFWEHPREMAQHLRAASRELERLAGDQLLAQAQDGFDWYRAPLTSRLANRAFRVYRGLPGVLKPPFARLTRRLLLLLEDQARREQPRKDRIQRLTSRFQKGKL